MGRATAERRTRRRKSWAEQQSPIWYRACVALVSLLIRFWIRCYRDMGAEKVPHSGGVFVVCNHTTGMDPFLLGYPLRRHAPRGPGKIELFANPAVGYIMRKIGMFPLRQGVADTAAVRTMIELYRAGKVVIVYPEGGRSPSGEMRPFLPEFARLMIKLRAPLVPAAVAGGKQLLPIGHYIPRRNSPVVVTFGDPFDLSTYYDCPLTPDVARAAAEYMQGQVAAVLAEARREREKLRAAC